MTNTFTNTMKSVSTAILKLAVIFLVICSLIVLLALDAVDGLLVLGMMLASLIYTIIAMKRQMPLVGRRLAWPASIIVGAGLLLCIGGVAHQQQVRDQRLLEEREQYLVALRASNVSEYLAELRSTDPDRWYRELAELDPEAYEAESDRRSAERMRQSAERMRQYNEARRAEEAARAAARAEADRERQERHARACRNTSLAYIVQQDPVRERLVAPTTARFPSRREAAISTTDNCIFRIRSYLDSQNRFGAMIRTYYETEIQHFPAWETWRVLSIQFYE